MSAHAPTHDDNATPAPIDLANDALERLNTQPAQDAFALFLRCSHSEHWSRYMLGQLPFADALAFSLAAHDGWQCASNNDWLDAFAGHPKIGDVEYLRSRFDQRAIGEQGQLLSAPEEALEALAQLNREYEARHGFIFIICASGLDAVQMLEALRARIHRPTDVEFVEAAKQHAAINQLRIEGALRT